MAGVNQRIFLSGILAAKEYDLSTHGPPALPPSTNAFDVIHFASLRGHTEAVARFMGQMVEGLREGERMITVIHVAVVRRRSCHTWEIVGKTGKMEQSSPPGLSS